MHILPAVDIKGGKAVRLLHGRADRETVYNYSPLAAAQRWAEEGATYLHVVDLDGAFEGVSENEKHIFEIINKIKVPVEVGGGIRTLGKARRLLEGGVERIIIGTKALESREFLDELLKEYPGRINVGIDAIGGMVAIKGWVETSRVSAEDFLEELSGSPIGAIIYTDITRDGALAGPNLESIARATEITDIPIIASGGVTSIADVQALARLPLFGIIIGKALYDNAITLQEAISALK
ncbi:MAG: 1-(5-phosphoribosyl)-5-[(5-phosphoribosylamino)methylideneamino]imidazole-4-carboxamide isomerase [Planctomycetes bacterium]|nr:1-(5-phosphoribosyl)-5-[(5-phosphoribosylamino)methylideneamino]imidazole-4-carboxamide isomerase [Planctomycetota bacterium]